MVEISVLVPFKGLTLFSAELLLVRWLEPKQFHLGFHQVYQLYTRGQQPGTPLISAVTQSSLSKVRSRNLWFELSEVAKYEI